MFSKFGSRLAARSSVWGRRTLATSSVEALGLDKEFGLSHNGKVYRNLTYPEIHEHELKQGSGSPDMFFGQHQNGCVAVDTGEFTGRSPTDKWIVKQKPSADNLWWGKVNQAMDGEVFDELFEKVQKFYAEEVGDLYVLDAYCGGNPNSTKKVRFVAEMAWQHHFVTNMFIRPDPIPQEDFEPEYTVINACKVVDEKWKEHNLNSSTVIAFNVEKKVAIILGSWYGGEMKKGIFSMMNYWLPLEGIMPMHCSANSCKETGETALFFGLSGTGKTTLSADPKRLLIGDDEHGWDNDGIFNFEGGCYAKTIDLSRENEPDIYDAIKVGALLENVSFNEDKTPDYYNTTKTQNGRVSYPIEHIDNHEPTLAGGHPTAMIFLTCDAFGVLPPVAKLSPEQAMYHFLSGYTAKVAGTERGITEPEATFSACFGAAFLTLHPTEYAKLLGKKLEEYKTGAYLVNTGWSGGAYGEGDRMSIQQTRACIDGILNGAIENSEFETHPVFQFEVPTSLPGVPADVLSAKDTWADKNAYEATVQKLAGLFKANFVQYTDGGVTDYTKYGPL
jgi:ATP-dependent phosphoenolpyruvate carboxykinase